mmetsp:Transcript_2381/g.7412  ORF Transcript_2381/g.7412 Transcript_2381/m.7412 type:complete len:298 (-) Transcript_2381:221-1114(-)
MATAGSASRRSSSHWSPLSHAHAAVAPPQDPPSPRFSCAPWFAARSTCPPQSNRVVPSYSYGWALTPVPATRTRMPNTNLNLLFFFWCFRPRSSCLYARLPSPPRPSTALFRCLFRCFPTQQAGLHTTHHALAHTTGPASASRGPRCSHAPSVNSTPPFRNPRGPLQLARVDNPLACRVAARIRGPRRIQPHHRHVCIDGAGRGPPCAPLPTAERFPVFAPPVVSVPSATTHMLFSFAFFCRVNHPRSRRDALSSCRGWHHVCFLPHPPSQALRRLYVSVPSSRRSPLCAGMAPGRP